MPDLALEIAAGAPALRIAGVDEAGRGPLAGPVLAAAVVLPCGGLPEPLAAAIDDSKVLSAAARRALFPGIVEHCAIGIGRAEVEEIDRINILQATFLAMTRALAVLPMPPDWVLIDGRQLPPGLSLPGQGVIGGDGKSLSIAAASIVAKVTRDRLMTELAARHPDYGWDHNAGYPTREHVAAIRRVGVTVHHRRSFGPVARQIAVTSPSP